jgi:phosphatidylethanolamine/phosphatidyl-N-methylethanolamine N-methyltransferase
LSWIVSIDADSVRRAYARWGPIFVVSFGRIAEAGRVRAVDTINRREGSVLEVGVGTGISLARYKPHLKVTAIDLSPEMLAKAREKVENLRLDHVSAVLEMDASDLAFEDASFDTVVAMYVMTVVPDPEKVMAELERVCKPGGQVIIVNHFSAEGGVRGLVERALAPFAASLGWRPEFPVDRVLGREALTLTEQRALQPLGLFTMLRFVKDDPAMPPAARDMVRHAGEPRPIESGVREDPAY